MTQKEVVLVTGGLGGIGFEVAKKYSNDKFNLVIADISDNFDNELEYDYVKTDVTRVDDVKNLISFIESKYKKLNHIISLAGLAVKGELHNDFTLVDFESISQTIDLNLKSHLYLIREALPLMKRTEDKNKSISVISSVNAISSFGLAGYSAAKSGLYGIVKSMCAEFGRDGIRINAISPGTVPTPATLEENKDFDKLLATTTLNRFATTKDVANVAYMLTNQVFSITGQNIVVDGGQTTKAQEVNKED